MRLVMMGTGPFAVPTLRKLAASRHEVVLVVSRPSRVRKNQPPPPIHTAAAELGLELWTPSTINAPEAVDSLVSLSADLLVVCDYGEILRPPALAATRLGGVNLHGSLLPKYRGAAPVQWAILAGDTETGNTVIQMTPGLDAGPSLGQQTIAIDPDETADQLEQRLAELGSQLVLEVVDQLAADCTSPVPQDASRASKAPRFTKEDGHIDWSLPAEQIKNRVRALYPWPRCYSFWNLESREPLRVNIDRVQFTTDLPPQDLPPGTPLAVPQRLIVATGTTPLEILTLQPAGKRPMAGGEFLRGYGGGSFAPPAG